MRERSGANTSYGPENWTDTYSRGGVDVFNLPHSGALPYTSLEWDYSQRRPEWQQRRRGEAVFVPPTSVHTFDRKPVQRRARLSLSYPATAEERAYDGFFFPPKDAIEYHGIQAFDWSNSLIKAQGNLKDVKANLGEAFLEARKTADLISKSLYSLCELAKELIQIKKQGLRNIVGSSDDLVVDISQLWLEYKYAWDPLYKDAYGAYELLRDRDKRRPYLITGKGKTTSTHTQRGSHIDLYDYWGTKATLGWEGTAKVVSRSKLIFAVPFDADSWQRKTAVDNPALITWEILPLSVFADWWLPIGDYLNAIGYADGLLFKGGYTTVVSEVEVRYITDEANSRRGVAYASCDKSPCVTAKYHRRVAFDRAPPVPFPRVDDGGLRGSRIASAAAVLMLLLQGKDHPLIKY